MKPLSKMQRATLLFYKYIIFQLKNGMASGKHQLVAQLKDGRELDHVLVWLLKNTTYQVGL